MPDEDTAAEAPAPEVQSIDHVEVALVLTVGEINVILQMFGERQLKDVINLFSKIRMQADRYIAQRAENARRITEANNDAKLINEFAAKLTKEPASSAPDRRRRGAKPGAPH